MLYNGQGKEGVMKKERKGFTLIELLVVIGIIVLLAGMLLVALRTAVRKAHAAATSNLIKQIDQACRSYYNDYGKYPPDNKGDGTTPDADVANNALYKALTSTVSRKGAPPWGPYMDFQARFLEGTDPDCYIIDGYRKHIMYDNNWTEGPDYQGSSAGDDLAADEFDSQYTDHNKEFDLLSPGLDGVFGTSDDIGNW